MLDMEGEKEERLQKRSAYIGPLRQLPNHISLGYFLPQRHGANHNEMRS
jgi:hypothetical protein